MFRLDLQKACFSLMLITLCVGQWVPATLEAQNESARIEGVLINPRKDLSIDFSKLELNCVQQVDLPPISGPAALASMSRDQRRAWFQSFRESEEGKALFAERKRLLDGRKKFKSIPDESGRFSLNSIPAGMYQLTGKVEKTLADRVYIFEWSSNVSVNPAKETSIDLGKTPIEVTRLRRVGESIEDFKASSFDDSNKMVQWKEFKGKHVLFYFWGMDSERSLIELEVLQELKDKLKSEKMNFEILGVCLNVPSDISKEFRMYRKWDWHVLNGKEKDRLSEAFGVRRLPEYFLVDSDGKIALTSSMFRELFKETDLKLESIIKQVLAGKDMQKVLDQVAKDRNK